MKALTGKLQRKFRRRLSLRTTDNLGKHENGASARNLNASHSPWHLQVDGGMNGLRDVVKMGKDGRLSDVFMYRLSSGGCNERA
jgi:hypothetical protein